MSSSSSAAYATPVPERDGQLLSVGKQCSHSSCQLVDFLPFKCQHCAESFCQEHFMPKVHRCPKYDETKHNRIAPNCPFCNEPVAIRVGQDPNNRMEEHFAKECSVMLGKTAKKSTPICERGKCGKALFAPIRCDKCQKQFCPTHRFPDDHACSAIASKTTAAPSSKPGAIPSSSRLLNLNVNAKTLETKASAAGAATVGAIKKAVANANASTSSSASTSQPVSTSSATSNSHSNPFSKTDRSSPLFSSSPNPTSTTTTTTITTSTMPTPITVSPKLKPEPAVRFGSFVPRPIFATA